MRVLSESGSGWAALDRVCDPALARHQTSKNKLTHDIPMSATLMTKTELEEIEFLAAKPSSPITLRQLYEHSRLGDEGTAVEAAQYLHREMPIRLAKMVRELEKLPPALLSTSGMQLVLNWYVQSFREIREFPFPQTSEGDLAFTELITKIKNRHKNQVQVMSRGVREYLDRTGKHSLEPELQRFLDSFFLSRIGIRVLLGHHTAHRQRREGWSGIICAQTSPQEVAEQAIDHAAQICRRTYGDPPRVKILGKTSLRFKYIPSHLHLMLFELLKNSFRATIEHSSSQGQTLPPVYIIIAGGLEDVSIKISDQGGGIPRSGIKRIWSYTYTTAVIAPPVYGTDQDVMAGHGYGLPLSRLYARYFGGDLSIISLEGWGTDAFLHLSRLGTQEELIR